jgi:hypothetical protein
MYICFLLFVLIATSFADEDTHKVSYWHTGFLL